MIIIMIPQKYEKIFRNKPFSDTYGSQTPGRLIKRPPPIPALHKVSEACRIWRQKTIPVSMEKGGIVMDISIRIAFLESRLHRLSTRKGRDNAGVCRKISREIRNLKKKRQSENLVTEN